MRRLMVLMTALLMAFAAEARPKKTEFRGQLLTYGQLMRLSSAKRVQYLREVADLLVIMERSQQPFDVAENSRLQDMKEQLASLMRMVAVLPEAEAANPRPELVPRWDGRAREWVCRGQNVAFDPALGTCAQFKGGTILTDKDKSFLLKVGSCDAQTQVAITVEKGNRKYDKCIPNSAWEALSRERQSDLRAGTFYPPGRFKGETADSSKALTLGAGQHNIDGTRKDQAPAGPAAPVATTPPVATALPANTEVKPLGPNVVVTDMPPDAVFPAPSTPAPSANRPGEVAATNTPDQPAVVQPIKPEEPPAAAEPAPPAAPTECVKKNFNCPAMSQAERDKLIRKFRVNANAKTCVAGGFFTSTKSARSTSKPVCEVVREYKFTNGKSKKCGKPNEALCNPTVFCLGLKVDDKLKDLVKNDADVKKVMSEKTLKSAATDSSSGTQLLQLTLCAPSGQDLTANCNKVVENHVAGATSMFGGKSRGESYVACDSARVTGLALQDDWTKLRGEVEKFYQQTCDKGGEEDFNKLFCAECQIVADRIMAMNQKATGEKCPYGGSPAATPAGEPETGDGKAIREKGI